MVSKHQETVRLGDYEADFRRRELRRSGIRVRIQGKPLAVLELLVENAGEIVTREELRRRLWPDDVFVDFDKNLATAVNKLRFAFCDTASRPRFIETVPRLGYRLIVPVQIQAAVPIRPAEPPTLPPQPESQPPAVSTPVFRRRFPWILAGAAVVLATIAIRPSQTASSHRADLLSKGPIVVADFANSTGDRVFDGALRQGLMAQLEQSRFLNLTSDTRIGDTLALMERPRDTFLSPQVAREICLRTGGAATIVGSISTIGSQYLLNLRAEGCKAGELLGEEQMTSASKEKLLAALADSARSLRSQLGESLQSVRTTDRPPEDVTTASLDALEAYSIGYRILLVDNNSHAAIPFFRKAIALDPNFAMAWARLGRCYDSEEENGLAAESFARAHDLRTHASEREDLYIDAYYQYIVLGDLDAAARSFRIWAETYPDDYTPHASLGNIYVTLGQFEQAITERKAALRIEPGVGLNYGNLVASLVGMRRFDEARAVQQQAQARNLDSPEIHLVMAWVAWAEGRQAEHDAILAPVRNDPLVEQWALEDNALIAAYEGRFHDARELERSALDGYRRIDRMQAGWVHVAQAGVREAFAGNFERAREDAHTALANDRSRDVQGCAAIALALAGDASESSRLAADLAAQYPQSTIVQRHFLPAIRAAIALRGGRPAEALAALVPAEPYELGVMGSVAVPAYLRGEAYLALKDGHSAADTFTRLIDNCPYPGTYPCSLALLQLARACALSGDRARARAAYDTFFALWKAPDRDAPIFRSARLDLSGLAPANSSVASIRPAN